MVSERASTGKTQKSESRLPLRGLLVLVAAAVCLGSRTRSFPSIWRTAAAFRVVGAPDPILCSVQGDGCIAAQLVAAPNWLLMASSRGAPPPAPDSVLLSGRGALSKLLFCHLSGTRSICLLCLRVLVVFDCVSEDASSCFLLPCDELHTYGVSSAVTVSARCVLHPSSFIRHPPVSGGLGP